MTDLNDPDPLLVEAVTGVRDRFGAHGLRELIALAQRELAVTERAEAALSQLAEDRP